MLRVLVVGCLGALGCEQAREAAELPATVQRLKAQVSTLEGQVSQFTVLLSRVAAVERDIETLRGAVRLVDNRIRAPRRAELDPVSRTYGRVDTTSGFFLVAVENVKAHADGVRVSLSIGNPLSAKYSGFTLKVKWGPRFTTPPEDAASEDSIAAYLEWMASLQSAEHRSDSALVPGRWNRVDVALAPAKPEDVGYLEVEMETDTVSLLQER